MSKEAMKLALEALESCGWNDGYAGENQYFHDDLVDKAITALRQVLAEQQPTQQEPVAWMDGYRNIYSLEEKAAGCPEATIALVPMANHKKTSGSPIKELNCICGAVWEGDELVHLPRPPAQRKPLTEPQKQALAESWFAEDWAITKAIGMMFEHEHLLGIKENT